MHYQECASRMIVGFNPSVSIEFFSIQISFKMYLHDQLVEELVTLV